jgi:uncharacterized oxidoreductase
MIDVMFTAAIQGMLQNKTILITGGGSGIGEAFALQLASGNRVIICGRNEEKLKRVSSKHPNISYRVTDLADFNSIDNLFVNLKTEGIKPDVLFNNAGVVELWELTRSRLTSKEVFEKLNTNLAGAVAMIQHFITQADPSAENMIINNTSEIAILPVPILPLYSASKTALSVFTKALRVQLKRSSFRVVELLPPGIDTDMPKQLNNKGKLMNANDFARTAIAKINAGKTEYAPGPNVPLMKFFRRFFPQAGMNLLDMLSRKQLA